MLERLIFSSFVVPSLPFGALVTLPPPPLAHTQPDAPPLCPLHRKVEKNCTLSIFVVFYRLFLQGGRFLQLVRYCVVVVVVVVVVAACVAWDSVRIHIWRNQPGHIKPLKFAANIPTRKKMSSCVGFPAPPPPRHRHHHHPSGPKSGEKLYLKHICCVL